MSLHGLRYSGEDSPVAQLLAHVRGRLRGRLKAYRLHPRQLTLSLEALVRLDAAVRDFLHLWAPTAAAQLWGRYIAHARPYCDERLPPWLARVFDADSLPLAERRAVAGVE